MDLISKVSKEVDRNMDELKAIRNYLYENPEVGGTEEKASRMLTESLKAHGFTVTMDYFDFRYAFRADYKAQKAGPAIGIFAEFDALPEIGHGCGHNLICTASLAAAYGLKAVIEEIGGSIIVFGTPGEENLCSKTELSEKGAFDDADIGMMVHPNPTSYASVKTRAIESLQIEFFGKSSHAGTAPEEGINAVDAAVYCYTAINTEKQYFKDTSVYGIINYGGNRASIINDYSSLKYFTRAWSIDGLRELREFLDRCAKSAALITGCTYKISNYEPTNHEVKSNKIMTELFDDHMIQLGAEKGCRDNLSGSTDMGDVSYRIPSIHPWPGLDCPQYLLHSKGFCEATITEKGDKFIERCGKAMALTAVDVITRPGILEKIKEEFAAS